MVAVIVITGQEFLSLQKFQHFAISFHSELKQQVEILKIVCRVKNSETCLIKKCQNEKYQHFGVNYNDSTFSNGIFCFERPFQSVKCCFNFSMLTLNECFCFNSPEREIEKNHWNWHFPTERFDFKTSAFSDRNILTQKNGDQLFLLL